MCLRKWCQAVWRVTSAFWRAYVQNTNVNSQMSLHKRNTDLQERALAVDCIFCRFVRLLRGMKIIFDVFNRSALPIVRRVNQTRGLLPLKALTEPQHA
jgi:hypothetical protein